MRIAPVMMPPSLASLLGMLALTLLLAGCGDKKPDAKKTAAAKPAAPAADEATDAADAEKGDDQ